MKPETVHLAIVFADDTVGIMAFVTNDRRAGWTRSATVEEVEKEIARSSFDSEKLPVKSWAFVDHADVPKDRTYRNALRHDGETFSHDMSHARELHRGLLREARAYRLLELDVAYLRADEQGNTQEKGRIGAEKQRLRDIPAHPAIAAAQTIESLKAVWPMES